MSYYRVISNLGNRKYLIESLDNGAQREMQIRYNTIVRVSESGCQVVENVASDSCKCVSPDLVFAKNVTTNAIYPVERLLRSLVDIHTLNVDNVVEIELHNSQIGLYKVVEISKISKEGQELELVLQEIGRTKNGTTTYKVSVIANVKVLEPDYKLIDKDSLILVDTFGKYYEYSAISFTIDHKYTLHPGQVINITTKAKFSIAEMAEQLGTTSKIILTSLRNILPDKSKGNSFAPIILDLMKSGDVDNHELSQGESYRLINFLQRPDTQCKSIIRWKYYIYIKNSNIPCPRYLDINNNLFKAVIPYQHLDMGKYVKIIDWLSGKIDIANDVESYFSLFHTLYWYDQIKFLKKVLINHISRTHVLTNITKLELLIQYPQYVNINVLIFIHSLLKLNKDKTLLTNVELYHIWKSYLPHKTKGKHWLSLKDYVGTDLFCTCKGAIGFSVEDWWSPGVNADGKPALYISPNGKMDMVADHYYYSEIEPTLESAKEHRGFVVYRDEGDLANCSYRVCLSECPVLVSINNDSEYRNHLLSKVTVSEKENVEKEGDNDKDEYSLSYDKCPLISIPSWKYKWAEKYRDQCSVSNQPRITALYLWHNRNMNGKNHLFCEGVTAKSEGDKPALHRTAKIPFSWCGGNACFTDRYVVSQPKDIANRFNIYNVAVLMGLVSEKSKILFQYFHSRLNWLSIAITHLYCDSCNIILEANDQKQHSNSAHSIIWFECKNGECSQLHKSIYISHCWNDKCRSVIDSRETSMCSNNKYICPTCGVCCGDKMFSLKKQSGLHFNNARHFEEGKFFCRKCGKQMTKQGYVYYCADHPDVVTKPPRFDK